MDLVTDVTSTLGDGVQKSIKKYTREIGDACKSFTECVDIEESLKSIHKFMHPDQYGESSNIIHKPINKERRKLSMPLFFESSKSLFQSSKSNLDKDAEDIPYSNENEEEEVQNDEQPAITTKLQWVSLKKDSTDESYIYQSMREQNTNDSFVYKSTRRQKNTVTFMIEDEEIESNVEVENTMNAEICDYEGSRNATSRRRQFASARSSTVG